MKIQLVLFFLYIEFLYLHRVRSSLLQLLVAFSSVAGSLRTKNIILLRTATAHAFRLLRLLALL